MDKHTHTDEITCLYCDYELGDSWEYRDSGEAECPQCEKTFEFERHTTVHYSSRRKDCEQAHEFGHAHVSRVTQETTDRWNRERFCGRSDHKPHDLWIRKCANCEHAEYRELPLNSPNPWPESEAA